MTIAMGNVTTQPPANDSLEELGDLVQALPLEIRHLGILGRVADGHQQHRVLVEGPGLFNWTTIFVISTLFLG